MDARQRKEITDEFFHYRRLTQTQLWDQYSAYEHWAKIEVPNKSRYVSCILYENFLELLCGIIFYGLQYSVFLRDTLKSFVNLQYVAKFLKTKYCCFHFKGVHLNSS